MLPNKQKIFTIDCTNKRLGSIATHIARILMGKNSPDYVPNKDVLNFVYVEHLEAISFHPKKLQNKLYIHHTDYPGGLKTESLGHLFERNPQEVLRRAVKGMLPKNILRGKRLKRLRFR